MANAIRQFNKGLGRSANRFTLSLVLVGTAIICIGCSSRTSRNRDATVSYWAELSRICCETESQVRSAPKPTSAAEAAEKLSHGQALFNQLASRILHLKSSNVDEEVLGLAADLVQSSRAMEALLQDVEQLVRQGAVQSSPTQMAGNMVESFLRGALGDPLGKQREVQLVNDKMQIRGEQLQSRWFVELQKSAELDARELKLRGVLAKRYGQEFAPLSLSNGPK